MAMIVLVKPRTASFCSGSRPTTVSVAASRMLAPRMFR